MTDYSGYDQARPRRRHPLRWIIIAVVVVLAILVGVDFAAKSYAEGQMASQIQQQGFPKKPDVSIEGFPFLTQVLECFRNGKRAGNSLYGATERDVVDFDPADFDPDFTPSSFYGIIVDPCPTPHRSNRPACAKNSDFATW